MTQHSDPHPKHLRMNVIRIGCAECEALIPTPRSRAGQAWVADFEKEHGHGSRATLIEGRDLVERIIAIEDEVRSEAWTDGYTEGTNPQW